MIIIEGDKLSSELKCCDSILAVCNTVFWVAVWWVPILYHSLNFHVRIDMVGLWRVIAEKVLCCWYYSFFQSVRFFDIKFAPCWYILAHQWRGMCHIFSLEELKETVVHMLISYDMRLYWFLLSLYTVFVFDDCQLHVLLPSYKW
jgi:hypothetical protein